jgi:hypothetical protein
VGIKPVYSLIFHHFTAEPRRLPSSLYIHTRLAKCLTAVPRLAEDVGSHSYGGQATFATLHMYIVMTHRNLQQYMER